MSNEITNNDEVGVQINIGNNSGPIITAKPTRWTKRFQRLKQEVESDTRYDQFIDDLKTYNTKIDGKSTEEKLSDGNFNDKEIFDAIVRKERYSKKLERNKNFETAQVIDTELFALIKLNFETYVEPLIIEGSDKREIKQAVTEYVIMPILKILNEEGSDDTFLNYSADDILGMIYFLTQKCHLNWTDYDNI
jgi:hypothetical protein